MNEELKPFYLVTMMLEFESGITKGKKINNLIQDIDRESNNEKDAQLSILKKYQLKFPRGFKVLFATTLKINKEMFIKKS